VRPKLSRIIGPIAGLLLLMAGALTAIPQKSAIPVTSLRYSLHGADSMYSSPRRRSRRSAGQLDHARRRKSTSSSSTTIVAEAPSPPASSVLTHPEFPPRSR
jgi:hypothetical protein